MIKAVVFDLDNTLLDFMKMKSVSINAAIDGMIKCGMSIDKDRSIDEIFNTFKEVTDSFKYDDKKKLFHDNALKYYKPE